MKYLASLYAFESHDARSHVLRFIDHRSGARVTAICHASANNLRAGMLALGFDSSNSLFCVVPCNAREFKFQGGSSPELNGSREEIAIFIRASLDLKEKSLKIGSYHFFPVDLSRLYSELDDAVTLGAAVARRFNINLNLGQARRLLARLNKYRG